jgi:DNA-binding NtrC family response regulator
VISAPPLIELCLHSPALEPHLRGAARAAQTDAPILILGEPGTGRSTLARALHTASKRSSGPLVEVDISAIPSSLFESELFGHRAGAFTGAVSALAGRVATADRGTLLLDHVEEIPIAAQPKLLRLLAESSYAPLGGIERRADVRFLGIGAADLRDRVAQRTFRTDLFYRLEVITLYLPPLRDRRQDLEPLLDHFLADLAERFGRLRPELKPAAWDWMQDYDWPGNLRELRNTLERALIVQGEGPLDPPCPDRRHGVPASLREVERQQILRALAYTRGHQGKAAELLGISRKTLWEKRRRYGIP